MTAVEVVSDTYSTFLSGGPDALLERYEELFTPDFEFHPALIGRIEGDRIYVGRDEFAEYWRDFRSAFARAEYTEGTFEPLGGDRVLVLARIRAEGATSGAPFDQEAAYVISVRDGLVAEMRTFFSRDDAMRFAAESDPHGPLIADMEAFFDAVERGDRGKVFELVERRCHPDCELFSAVSGRIEGTRRGHEEINAFFAEFLDVWDPTYSNMRFASVGRDAMVGRYHQRLEGRGSGVVLESTGGVVWWLEGERATRVTTYLDPDELERVVAEIEAADA